MTGAFAFPTDIRFGSGEVSALGRRLDELRSQSPLIITDPGVVATRAFRKTLDALPSGVAVFSDIHSNPTRDDVEHASRAFVEQRCDSVIGIGGGSAIDVAKIIRLRVKLTDWQVGTALPSDDRGLREALRDLAPLIAIPTTAGTGSEVGRSSVITIDGQKRVIFHPSLLARLVILDPELTVELPAKLTAATGADALTHCIESFTSPTFHPLCDGIALEGIHLIANALPRAIEQPTDIDARGRMLVAATMGGIAFQKDLGAAHSLAHPLSAICGLHHGLANALVLPTVMRFNAARKPKLYERVGLAMAVNPAIDERTIEAVASLLIRIGVSPGLRAHGVTDAHLPALADQAFADSCHQTNPVPVTRDELYRLYVEAM